MSPAAAPRSCITGAWKRAREPVRELMRDVKAVDWLPLEDAVERLSRGYERAFLEQCRPDRAGRGGRCSAAAGCAARSRSRARVASQRSAEFAGRQREASCRRCGTGLRRREPDPAYGVHYRAPSAAACRVAARPQAAAAPGESRSLHGRRTLNARRRCNPGAPNLVAVRAVPAARAGCAGTYGCCGWPARGGRPGCGGRPGRCGCPARGGRPGCVGEPAAAVVRRAAAYPVAAGEPGCCCPCRFGAPGACWLTGAGQPGLLLLSGTIWLTGLQLSGPGSVRAHHSAAAGRAGVAGSDGSD